MQYTIREEYPYPGQDPFFVSLMLSIACKPEVLASPSLIPETLVIYRDLVNNKILISTSTEPLITGHESMSGQRSADGAPNGAIES
ncbi:MAG TPA: hypothetical protein VK563_07295 [Puia sp.]|nr:hypothetical protein [Puia sp.]